ncbi:MAG: GNAT superfamily N-acetyltransferase [Gammaproteobacteria bacterium]|jgi:GNAT superfamily N-acetyltransferase
MNSTSDPIVYRQCLDDDFDSVYFIINEAASAYRGLLPSEHLTDPYMSRQEFRSEIAAGVEFWGYEVHGSLRGVMGIQRSQDVMLIRHAYTRSEFQGLGIGSGLLNFLLAKTQRPVLVGTWSALTRSINFYERHGFALVERNSIKPLLEKYWQVPASQMDSSVVLVNVPVEKLRL